MKILFQPITMLHKPFIHRTFRAVIGCWQPITSPITYHRPIQIKSTANIIRQPEAISVSCSETKCFFKMRKYSANLLKFK